MTADPRTDLAFHVMLRKHRRDREDSQQYVADLVGVKQASVARWESGSQAPEDEDVERRLARYLGMSVATMRKMIARDRLEARKERLEAELRQVTAQVRTFKIQ